MCQYSHILRPSLSSIQRNYKTMPVNLTGVGGSGARQAAGLNAFRTGTTRRQRPLTGTRPASAFRRSLLPLRIEAVHVHTAPLSSVCAGFSLAALRHAQLLRDIIGHSLGFIGHFGRCFAQFVLLLEVRRNRDCGLKVLLLGRLVATSWQDGGFAAALGAVNPAAGTEIDLQFTLAPRARCRGWPGLPCTSRPTRI